MLVLTSVSTSHVNDVVNVLASEDIRDAILVGHSSSGAAITGVADRTPERLTHVVYLDAFVPIDGQSVFDLVAPERRQMMEELIRTEGKDWLLPRFAPPPWETIVRNMWGVTDDDDVRWMLERLRPTPVGHFRDPVRRANAAAEKLPRAYVRCTQDFQTRASISTRRWLSGIRCGNIGSCRHRITPPSRFRMESRKSSWSSLVVKRYACRCKRASEHGERATRPERAWRSSARGHRSATIFARPPTHTVRE